VLDGEVYQSLLVTSDETMPERDERMHAPLDRRL